MLVEYNIDELSIIIYNRDRAVINALEAVFLAIESILYTQYIDIAVKAQAYKIFRQQKSKDSIRYVASELAAKFLVLYKTCRFAKTEELFDTACLAILIRATYDEANDSNSSDNDNGSKQDDEVDAIVRLVAINKRASCNLKKDTSIRQLKIIQYLERHQQVYKEKYVKAQTDKMRYFGFDVLLVGEGTYVGLKKQTASARNDILIFILKLYLFFDSYYDRYKHVLAKVQNTSSTRFVNRPQF